MTATLRRLVALADVPRGRAILSVLLATVAVCFGVALLTAAGYLISRAAEQPPILSLTVTIVAVRFFGLARPLTRYLDRLVSHDLALRSLGHLRARFYERIEPLAPAELDGFRRGDLLRRMVGDVDALQGVFVRGLSPAVAAVATGALCVAAVSTVLPAAAIILALGLLVAGAAVPTLAWALARMTGSRRVAARAELTSELVDVLRGAPELVAYGCADDALARIHATDATLARLGRRDALVTGLADALSVLVAGLTVVGVLAVAVDAHAHGALDPVLVATVAFLALASFEAVAPLPGAARELSEAVSSGSRVLELTDRVPTIRDPDDPLPRPARSAVVALEGVTAQYGWAEEPVLEDVDLVLAPGRRVALVGPSGAGKTTVTHLLFRFLDPSRGRVTIAGRDARDYRQADVRRMFALAGQDAHLFDASIRANLLLAQPGASEPELVDALRRAGIEDWVSSLPDGLDTVVGESGARLSGGQRQRLVVARALLADAPVLILDEPTAHLDVAAAEALVADVLRAADDRAVLLVTHRPEGLDQVDAVVRLADGRVDRAA
jgi:ATP-binding cassette, subfamily C, bacterial CydC